MLKKQSLTYFENEKLSADSFENQEIASCESGCTTSLE